MINFNIVNSELLKKNKLPPSNKVFFHTKPQTALIKISVTYVGDNKILARQVNNNELENYINNKNGSVIKLKKTSNRYDNQKYSYDAYGALIDKNYTQNLFYNAIQYNGERTDINTNLQYLRARFYNLIIKRFINLDTYDLLNKFSYVQANPVIKNDPSGHVCCSSKIADEEVITKEKLITAQKVLANMNIKYNRAYILTTENVKQIFKNAYNSGLKISCSHVAILFALSTEGLKKIIYANEIIKILLQNKHVNELNYSMLGMLNYKRNTKHCLSFFNYQVLYNNIYEFFLNHSTVKSAILISRTHAAFWKRNDGDLWFSFWFHDNCDMAKLSDQLPKIQKKITKRKVYFYVLLESFI